MSRLELATSTLWVCHAAAWLMLSHDNVSTRCLRCRERRRKIVAFSFLTAEASSAHGRGLSLVCVPPPEPPSGGSGSELASLVLSLVCTLIIELDTYWNEHCRCSQPSLFVRQKIDLKGDAFSISLPCYGGYDVTGSMYYPFQIILSVLYS